MLEGGTIEIKKNKTQGQSEISMTVHKYLCGTQPHLILRCVRFRGNHRDLTSGRDPIGRIWD